MYKTPFHSTIDHWFYENLLKNTTNCFNEDEHGLNFSWKIILSLFEWFHFKWPFNTGRKQYKQAVGTQVKGDHNCLKKMKITMFKNFKTENQPLIQVWLWLQISIEYTFNWFQKLTKIYWVPTTSFVNCQIISGHCGCMRVRIRLFWKVFGRHFLYHIHFHSFWNFTRFSIRDIFGCYYRFIISTCSLL